MLFPGLQRQRIAGFTVQIDRAPNDAPGHLPNDRGLAGHEAEVGPTGRQGYAEGLPFTADDVRAFLAPLARRFEQRQGGWVDYGDDQRTAFMRPVSQLIDALHGTEEGRLLNDHCDRRLSARVQGFQRRDATFHIETKPVERQALVAGNCLCHFLVNGIDTRRQQHACRLAAPICSNRHQRRFRHSRGAVV